MKFVALLSGGKDSIYSTLQSIRNNHELICAAHLAPPPSSNNADEGERDESYMYQTAGSEASRLQAEECMGVPLYEREISGGSRNTSLVYDNDGDDSIADDDAEKDEVEDLYLLLQHVRTCHPEIQAVSSGAILSTYQRTRIENVCSRLNLTSLAYMWRMADQASVLNKMLEDGIEAVLVRVACPPGLTTRHLGKSLRTLRDSGVLESLHEKWGMHVAGEGGEYETLVLDCPLFKLGRLVLEETEVVGDDCGDGVGVLRIIKCRVEKKEQNASSDVQIHPVHENGLQHDITPRVQALTSDINLSGHGLATASLSKSMLRSLHPLPNVRVMRGGLCHISAILSPTAEFASNSEDEAQLAVQEFLSILQTLRQILNRLSPSSSTSNKNKPQNQNDIFFVHLYLSQISHFAKINQHYQQFFGRHLPPSRSCVGVGSKVLPGGRRVMMDCVLQLGSGEYLRVDETKLSAGANQSPSGGRISTFVLNALKNKHHALRKTLHVQSISNWAPVCIGPYSQANVFRSSLVFLAGMIGLVPQTMQLITPSNSQNGNGSKDWQVQLYQSWRNAASVLDGLEDGGSVLGGKLEDCLGGLVYFSLEALNAATKQQNSETTDALPWHALWNTAECICNNAIVENGGIVMGRVDGVAASAGLDPSLYDEEGVLYGGYEDEETWREMTGALSSSTPVPQPSSDVPLLMVCLAELPMNAQAEVELVCASRRAASCLKVRTGEITKHCIENDEVHSFIPSDLSMLWDTGYDYPKPTNMHDGRELPFIQITSVSRSVGNGCACVSTITAYLSTSSQDMDESSRLANFDIVDILSKMIDSSISNAAVKGGEAPLFSIQNVLSVRLYHVAAVTSRNANDSTIQVDATDDGAMLRTQLHSVLALKCKQHFDCTAIKGSGDRIDPVPAYTVVPVLGVHLSAGSSLAKFDNNVTFLAMQVTLVDAIRMETEMWIRYGREKK